jgi:hypothetical protein
MDLTLDLGTDNPRSGARNRVDALRWPGDAPGAIASRKGDRVTARLPDGAHRWRCGGCGNLTRFDVTRTRRTTEYWHFALSGDHKVEESELLNESVESVTCRWCGRADAIELIDRNDATHAEDPAAG